jgi:hypothetical protein
MEIKNKIRLVHTAAEENQSIIDIKRSHEINSHIMSEQNNTKSNHTRLKPFGLPAGKCTDFKNFNNLRCLNRQRIFRKLSHELHSI